MKLFLDTSVLLAASGSPNGASREVFRLAPSNDWRLVATPYVVEEVVRNLPRLPLTASTEWLPLHQRLEVFHDVLTLDRPAIFGAAKDRPVLFGALAWGDALLTHDHGDFGQMIGGEFYGLPILTPGQFLERERGAGRLRFP